jgi:glycyl-tRNA synthetase beta subunit
MLESEPVMTPGEFERLFEDWERMREEISKLKESNRQLTEDVQNTARLAHEIYQYFETGKVPPKEDEIRHKILDLLRKLHRYLEV